MVDTQSRSGNCEWCNLTDEDKRYLLYKWHWDGVSGPILHREREKDK
jgi:hypothetical protein